MGKAKRRSFEEGFLKVPNSTAKAPEIKTDSKNISLEALGLIVNICCYSDEWDLHKTELYKRFAKNKRTSVNNAFKELTEANYIFEYKYRVGKKWEHVYWYDIIPYTSEQIEILRAEAIEEHGQIWDVDFAHPKMDTPKWTPQNQHISNTLPTQDKVKKDELKKDFIPLAEIDNNPNIVNDDDEKEPFEINIFAFKEFKKEFEDQFPNYFDDGFYSRIIEHMTKLELDFITYPEAVEQLKYMAEQRDKGLIIADSAKYFVGGIELRRTSRHAAMDKAKVRRAEKELKARKEKQEEEQGNKVTVPFYNWLEQ